MHIRVERDAFVDALGPVQGVVEAKKTLPILSHVLIDANPQGISLFGTDLDVGLQTQCSGEVLRPGAVAVSAKKLYEVARELPQAAVEFNVDPELHVDISCQRSTFRIKGLPRDEFPALPKLQGENEVSIDAGLFRDMLRKTLFAVSSDQTRYALTGVLLQVLPQTVSMVGTDGHRLALVRAPRPTETNPTTIEALVPKKAMAEVSKISRGAEAAVRLWLSENQFILNQGSTTMVARLIDGQFPNYEQVVPATSTNRISLQTEDLYGALRRTSAISGERTTPTEFEFQGGKARITCINVDLGEAHEEIPTEYAGPDLKVGFNARYILDFLAAVDVERVTIQITDPLSPSVFRIADDESYSCVIMPMRI
jgi:DNA polymerase-3 subunit beta